jgi:nucleoside-diphosphate-sugar epimerase
MKVLLTGAFGNIGSAALRELLQRGHQVRCFDVPSPANRKVARPFSHQVEIVWGDIRNPEDVQKAVQGMNAVLHLAFAIPYLSVTGRRSEDDPEWAREINVGGTRHIIEALQALADPPRLLFTSSLHIYGRTQDQAPPRTVSDPPQPIEHYAKHKVECEQMVRDSGLTWCIFRLGAALPEQLILDPGMFQVPLDNRIEFVHRLDVATALANALEADEAWGKVLLIGGGAKCQLYQRDIVLRVMSAVGIDNVPEDIFPLSPPYPVDWLDTGESQRILTFQNRTLEDYIQNVQRKIGIGRWFIRGLSPLIRLWLRLESRRWVHRPH